MIIIHLYMHALSTLYTTEDFHPTGATLLPPTFLTPVRGSMQANARAITCRSLCFAFSLNYNDASSVVLCMKLPLTV